MGNLLDSAALVKHSRERTSGQGSRPNAEEEEGLEAAARSLDAGQGLSLDAVRKRLEEILRR
jgi:hypothetical protein